MKRKQTEGDNITINDIEVEYLSTKDNEYCKMSYFKLLDKNKLKPIFKKECTDIKMPYWKTDQNDYILKIKDKYVQSKLDYVINNDIINISIDFIFYDYQEKDIKGYYAKLINVSLIKHDN